LAVVVVVVVVAGVEAIVVVAGVEVIVVVTGVEIVAVAVAVAVGMVVVMVASLPTVVSPGAADTSKHPHSRAMTPRLARVRGVDGIIAVGGWGRPGPLRCGQRCNPRAATLRSEDIHPRLKMGRGGKGGGERRAGLPVGGDTGGKGFAALTATVPQLEATANTLQFLPYPPTANPRLAKIATLDAGPAGSFSYK